MRVGDQADLGNRLAHGIAGAGGKRRACACQSLNGGQVSVGQVGDVLPLVFDRFGQIGKRAIRRRGIVDEFCSVVHATSLAAAATPWED